MGGFFFLSKTRSKPSDQYHNSHEWFRFTGPFKFIYLYIVSTNFKANRTVWTRLWIAFCPKPFGRNPIPLIYR